MLTYCVYSEAGGVAKTTLAANLGVAHARAGLDVLIVPLDPQEGDLSQLLQVDQDRADTDVDTLVHHLVERNDKPFANLIRTAEHGVDVVPEHNRLESLGDTLDRERDARADFGASFPIYTQLQRVLRDAGVADDYDVLIVDPPATSGPHLYNGLDATRNIVVPVEPSGKGQASVSGLDSLVSGLEAELEIEIGAIAAVPIKYKGTNDQEAILKAVTERGYDIPEVFRDRTSLFEGCWRKQCSAFRYMQHHRERRREYEIDTLAKFDRLARHLESSADITPPAPPEPGDVEHDPTTVVPQ